MGRRRHTDPRLCVGYIRTSTDKQHNSPDAQRAGIAGYAARHGLTVVSWHEDRLSGATPADARPGLQTALASLHATRAGGLIVLRRDRLSRDPVEARRVEDALKRMNARVVHTDQLTPGATDRARDAQADFYSANELAEISRRTREALATKRARGEKLGGPPPYGYRVAESRVPVSKDNPAGVVLRLVEDASEQSAIRRALALRTEGRTIAAIAAELDAGNYPCRGKRWHATSVWTILQRAAESRERVSA